MNSLISKMKQPKRLWQVALAFFMTIFTLIGAYADVKSLGFTIGKSDYQTIQKRVPQLKDIGINQYSKGKMLKGRGANWNIQGLHSATFIFDKKDKLTALILTMNKKQFKRIYGFLKSKYRLVDKQIPFVGNKSAKFKKDDVTIKINAPHMNFNMKVVYTTDAFDKAYQQIKNREMRKKNNHEQSQF